MIAMSMTVEQNFYIGQFKAELRDITLDLRNGFNKTAVEQDLSFRRCDQVGRNIVRSDIVQIPGDLEGRDRLIAATAGFVGLGKKVKATGKKECERNDDLKHDRITLRLLNSFGLFS
jgi:hypothetical protein